MTKAYPNSTPVTSLLCGRSPIASEPPVANVEAHRLAHKADSLRHGLLPRHPRVTRAERRPRATRDSVNNQHRTALPRAMTRPSAGYERVEERLPAVVMCAAPKKPIPERERPAGTLRTGATAPEALTGDPNKLPDLDLSIPVAACLFCPTRELGCRVGRWCPRRRDSSAARHSRAG